MQWSCSLQGLLESFVALENLNPGGAPSPCKPLLIDPEQEWVVTPDSLHGRSKNSAFLGQTHGRVVATFLRDGSAIPLKGPMFPRRSRVRTCGPLRCVPSPDHAWPLRPAREPRDPPSSQVRHSPPPPRALCGSGSLARSGPEERSRQKGPDAPCRTAGREDDSVPLHSLRGPGGVSADKGAP